MPEAPHKESADIWTKMSPPAQCQTCGWTGVPKARRDEMMFRVGFVGVMLLTALLVTTGLLPVANINGLWVITPIFAVWLGVPYLLRRKARCPSCHRPIVL